MSINPDLGRRVKIYHAGITKLCTKCFGEHKKQFCPTDVKVPWTDYVKEFINSNEDIPVGFNEKWIDIVNKVNSEQMDRQRHQEVEQPGRGAEEEKLTQEKQQSPRKKNSNETESANTTGKPVANPEPELKEPNEADFDIPTSKESYKRMVERFASIGLERWEIDKAIEANQLAFNRACHEHRNAMEKRTKSEEPKIKRAAQRNSLPKN